MTVGVVSPSGPLRDQDIGPMLEWLEREGYGVKVFPHVRGQWWYLAGSDEERAADLLAAYRDLEVDIVQCARGGYGCSRLLPLLAPHWAEMAATGKPLLGFSDITILHLALNAHGLPTVHAPMSSYVGQWSDAFAEESYRRALRGDFALPADAPRGETVVSGRAEGVVTGGCLSLLGDSQGTAYAFRGRDAIVLIEDVGEQGYRVDARLTHLLNAEALDGVRGIVVGEMTGTDEKADPPSAGVTWREIVRERLAPLGVPMIWGYPFGHVRHALSIPLGRAAVLDADAGTLEIVG